MTGTPRSVKRAEHRGSRLSATLAALCALVLCGALVAPGAAQAGVTLVASGTGTGMTADFTVPASVAQGVDRVRFDWRWTSCASTGEMGSARSYYWIEPEQTTKPWAGGAALIAQVNSTTNVTRRGSDSVCEATDALTLNGEDRIHMDGTLTTSRAWEVYAIYTDSLSSVDVGNLPASQAVTCPNCSGTVATSGGGGGGSGTCGDSTAVPAQPACTVELGADGAHRSDLTWIGIWAVVGLVLVLIAVPFWRAAFGLEGKLGNG